MSNGSDEYLKERIERFWTQRRWRWGPSLDSRGLREQAEANVEGYFSARERERGVRTEIVFLLAEKALELLERGSPTLPNWYFTQLLQYMTGSETKVLMYVAHSIFGGGRFMEEKATMREVGDYTGLGRTAIRNALRELEQAGVLQHWPRPRISEPTDVDWDYLRARSEEARTRGRARTAAATRKVQEKRSAASAR